MKKMKKMKKIFKIAVLLVILSGTILMWTSETLAKDNYLSIFNTKYGTTGTRLDTCNVCHQSQSTNLNLYGMDLKDALEAGFTTEEGLKDMEEYDSDGDEYSNIEEINSLTFPGDPNDIPTPTSTMPPVPTYTPIPTDTMPPPVAQYTFDVDKRYTFIKSGEIAQYILTINNTGNNIDTYSLTIENSSDINVSLSRNSVSIGAGATESILLNVTGFVTGSYTINVTTHPQSMLPTKTITTNTYIDIANITEFDIENGTTNGFIKTNVIIENHDNQSHWFALVVNGTINSTINNSTNIYPVVGTGIVRLDAKQSIKVPVLVPINSTLTNTSEFIVGTYESYAKLYAYDDQVLDIQGLIDSSGPINLITIKGHIKYTDIEGGCTYLEGDDGRIYELYKGTLPPIGTYVMIEGKIRNDMASICMIGQILEVISIREIK